MVLRYAHLSPDHLAAAEEKVSRPNDAQAASGNSDKDARSITRWLSARLLDGDAAQFLEQFAPIVNA